MCLFGALAAYTAFTTLQMNSHSDRATEVRLADGESESGGLLKAILGNVQFALVNARPAARPRGSSPLINGWVATQLVRRTA